MPIITMESGPLNYEQKEQLIKDLTETAARITHIPQQFFMVCLHELNEDNIGSGGEMVSEVKKRYLASQPPKST